MRTWVPAAVAIFVIAGLGYRVVSLGREVDRLSRIVGRAEKNDRRSEAAPERALDLSQRVDVLERRLSEANAKIALLAAHGAAPAGTTPEGSEKKKEEILSIIADEADRVISKQLEWHRENLMKIRKPGFQAFAQTAKLTESQNRLVWAHLETEADEIANLFRIPEIREDPSALLRELRAVLDATDERVRAVLDPAQMKGYLAARAVEQASLPGLRPDNPAQ